MNIKKHLRTSLLLSAGLSSAILAATPAVTVTAVPPAGSAGKAYEKKIVPSMAYTPCLASTVLPQTRASGLEVTNHFDQFTFTLKGTNNDAQPDGLFDYDLYFFFVNFGGTGTTITDAQIYAVSRYDPFNTATVGVHVQLYANAASIAPSTSMLLRASDFSAAAIAETIFGGAIRMDGFNLQQGTWLALTILADSATVNFTDASTWVAWDATPFILGLPWPAAGVTCS